MLMNSPSQISEIKIQEKTQHAYPRTWSAGHNGSGPFPKRTELCRVFGTSRSCPTNVSSCLWERKCSGRGAGGRDTPRGEGAGPGPAYSGGQLPAWGRPDSAESSGCLYRLGQVAGGGGGMVPSHITGRRTQPPGWPGTGPSLAALPPIMLGFVPPSTQQGQSTSKKQYSGLSKEMSPQMGVIRQEVKY